MARTTATSAAADDGAPYRNEPSMPTGASLRRVPCGRMLAMPSVFITGASGFIGRALATRYAAEGWEVRGVDLRADPAADVVAGDIGERGPGQLHAAGADLVVHTAAIVSGRATGRGAFWRANVLGTRHVVEAAER